MRKWQEVDEDTDSCLQRAGECEMLFVLLSRDPAAPVAIRAWIEERIRIGKNQQNDAQIVEAFSCARTMEIEIGKYKNDQTPESY